MFVISACNNNNYLLDILISLVYDFNRDHIEKIIEVENTESIISKSSGFIPDLSSHTYDLFIQSQNHEYTTERYPVQTTIVGKSLNKEEFTQTCIDNFIQIL